MLTAEWSMFAAPYGRLLRWHFLSVSLFLVAASAASVEELREDDRISIDAAGRFVDRHGRTRFFHGMNVVFKESPWLPPQGKFDANNSLNSEDIALLKAWGFNMVRLGVMWPAVEPQPGQIDTTYLDAVKGLTAKLAKSGVYTLVDLHQDLGTRRFCGEGFPEYYVDDILNDPDSMLSKARAFPFPLSLKAMPLNESGYPPLEECLKLDFGVYYATEKVGAVWNELYRRGSALNAGAMRYWKAVADAMKARPEIMGYELMNEPNAFCLDGNIGSCVNGGVLFGDKTEEKYLVPLYQDMAVAIRSVDRDTPIFYEPFPVPKLTSKFFKAPPLQNESQQVVAYHVYCQPGAAGAAVCHGEQDLYMKRQAEYAQEHRGIGTFMSEFGAMGADDLEMGQVERLLNLADQNMQSWAYWELKLFKDFTTQNDQESLYDAQGKVQEMKVKLLSRTYAQAVAGIPTRMEFSPGNATFQLDFILASSPAAPTIIYMNEALHYPHGYKIEVEPKTCLEVRQGDKNYLHLHVPARDQTSPCAGKSVSVRIEAVASSFGIQKHNVVDSLVI
eukprot:TRINITY_DN27933_c0_g1_i3.p1 TRINITY_DN27933_c0_g1~~TRINITY_DN27933_c0_g1_i3.p1  ORF type:complete len:575 (-),score=99.62 TRINITY_DN27933_c0_g1_i3:157-1833(-)